MNDSTEILLKCRKPPKVIWTDSIDFLTFSVMMIKSMIYGILISKATLICKKAVVFIFKIVDTFMNNFFRSL